MKHKLYSNTKRMSTYFCIGLAVMTVVALSLRFVFNNLAVVEVSAGDLAIVSNIEPASGQSDSDSHTTYSINSKIYFAQAGSKGNVFIKNPESSQFLISVDIVLSDSLDSLLATGFISPGASIDTSPLNAFGQTLENGVYQCTAKIVAYDPKTLEVKGKEDQNITLYIGQKPKEE